MVRGTHSITYTRSLNHRFSFSAPLSAHLESQNVEFMQFAFRWMNCLLMREISVQNTIRMWDTYLVRSFSSSTINKLKLCRSVG